jgi:hypothetical protein
LLNLMLRMEHSIGECALSACPFVWSVLIWKRVVVDSNAEYVFRLAFVKNVGWRLEHTLFKF